MAPTPTPHPVRNLSGGLRAPIQVERGEAARFTIEVSNGFEYALEVPMRQPMCDFVVTTYGGTEVWRWSQGREAEDIPTMLTLEPGKYRKFVVDWDLKDDDGNPVPNGMYWVEGRLKLDPSHDIGWDRELMIVGPRVPLDNMVKVHLEAPSQVHLGETVVLKMRVENITQDPLSLTVGQGLYDFFVTEEDSTEVWRWSRSWGVIPLYAAGLALQPGELEEYKWGPWPSECHDGPSASAWMEWDQRDNDCPAGESRFTCEGNPFLPGTYLVHGSFEASLSSDLGPETVLAEPQELVILPSPMVEATPAPMDEQLHLVAERALPDLLRMTVWVNETTVRPGETLRVLARLENLADDQAEAGKLVSVIRKGVPISIGITDPYGEPLCLRQDVGLRHDEGVFSFADSSGLKSNTEASWLSTEKEIQWDMIIRRHMEAFQAPNGTYTINVQFDIAEYLGQENPEAPPTSGPVVITYPVELVSSWDSLAADEAKQKALESPIIQHWVGTHTGEAVAVELDGRRYICCTRKQWVSVAKDKYEEALTATPSHSYVLYADYWLVNFEAHHGRFADRMFVRVDRRTGEVLDVSRFYPPDGVVGGIVASFRVSRGNEEEFFHVLIRNRETIEELLRMQRGKQSGRFLEGGVRPDSGPGRHNLPWSWHLDPEDVHFADSVSEGCDPMPHDVELNLHSHVQDTPIRFCPRNAQLLNILDFR